MVYGRFLGMLVWLRVASDSCSIVANMVVYPSQNIEMNCYWCFVLLEAFSCEIKKIIELS